MNVKQYTFAELAEKQVVNVADGRQLGHTCDMVFTAYGRILGLVVPGKKSFFKRLRKIKYNKMLKTSDGAKL